jgi:hypothetical protein
VRSANNIVLASPDFRQMLKASGGRVEDNLPKTSVGMR